MLAAKALIKILILITAWLLLHIPAKAQTNLLLNGGFEEVNTCTEYKAECGVEGWFYLKEVKAQMLSNDGELKLLGLNSYGINFIWREYTGFSPVIGAILPCGLQKGNVYTFRGIVSALLNPKLILKPGICVGERFYVPGRPFSKTMQPDSIIQITAIPKTNFVQFEYSFTATGTERYLTFGTYIEEDKVGVKKQLTGTQTVNMVLDNFELIPSDPKETICTAFGENKEKIYHYDFRHKEMDYSLYGKGELAIVFSKEDSSFITKIKEPPTTVLTDTLKLGDVFFDFNKAILKPGALKMLEDFFINNKDPLFIDSVYVEGHTDSIGSDKRNMALSLERCESIRQWLLLNSILSDPGIQVHPFGKTRPIATNSTPQGRSLNRRVELIIFRRNEK
ncbi:MAG: OmpA family protein [Chitinophagaceae bacterium]|nr:OmpA family protein [Chitinophagaceae bacterium]